MSGSWEIGAAGPAGGAAARAQGVIPGEHMDCALSSSQAAGMPAYVGQAGRHQGLRGGK